MVCFRLSPTIEMAMTFQAARESGRKDCSTQVAAESAGCCTEARSVRRRCGANCLPLPRQDDMLAYDIPLNPPRFASSLNDVPFRVAILSILSHVPLRLQQTDDFDLSAEQL
jgi:hypothetical protein